MNKQIDAACGKYILNERLFIYLVDAGAKEDLILKKQIRQSTTKILQRPSYFQASSSPQACRQTIMVFRSLNRIARK